MLKAVSLRALAGPSRFEVFRKIVVAPGVEFFTHVTGSKPPSKVTKLVTFVTGLLMV
jgi:hypothetical protein